MNENSLRHTNFYSITGAEIYGCLDWLYEKTGYSWHMEFYATIVYLVAFHNTVEVGYISCVYPDNVWYSINEAAMTYNKANNYGHVGNP
jgi:hypothetical protein